MRRCCKENPGDAEVLKQAKRLGFSDAFLGKLWGMDELEVLKLRQEHRHLAGIQDHRHLRR